MRRIYGKRCMFSYLRILAYLIVLCLLIILLSNFLMENSPSIEPTKNEFHVIQEVISDTDLQHPILRTPTVKSREKLSETSTILHELRLAMDHSWLAYKKYAWGMDEVLILSKTGSTWMNASLTLIDSLDTLWIYNMTEEFIEARDWIINEVDFNFDNDRVNLFETTIRVLGGLLSAFHLSGDINFLHKSSRLSDKLLKAFNSNSGIPFSDINLASGKGSWPLIFPSASLSEIGTLQLEFNELALLLKNGDIAKSAAKVSILLHKLPKNHGLLPIFMDTESLSPKGQPVITLGARGDSYYEYLLKVWVQTGKRIEWLASDYRTAITGVKNLLMRFSTPNHLTFIGELLNEEFSPKMDHLVCFLPGTLAYGYLHGMPLSHLKLAKRLIKTCMHMHEKTVTGLSPEIVFFNMANTKNGDLYVKTRDSFNLLRPETVESLFYLYQITKDPIYRVWGKRIFDSFQKYSKMPEAGYASMDNINSSDPSPRDEVNSFWIAETLKYLYLLFSDEAAAHFDLRYWVFNTEAHPFPLSDNKSDTEILLPLYSLT